MPKKSIPALATLALVTLGLAACGSSSSSSSSSNHDDGRRDGSDDRGLHRAPEGLFDRRFDGPGQRGRQPLRDRVRATSTGKLKAGQVLISNFNAKEGAPQSGQGTGTTIVQVSTAGKVTPFATIDSRTLPGSCPGGVGLTTALDILPGGYVVVGSLPTTNGKSETAQYGCLIVLDSEGKVIKTIASKNIQGPWDSTAKSEGSKTTLFVSNALNGGAAKGKKPINNSTVLRIDLESGEGQAPKVTGEQVVAEGIPWVDSPEALVLGPTGLALASNGTLYVASTQDNKILAIPEAATRSTAVPHGGSVLTEGGHLKEPLGMVLAPNGNIITTNGGDGNMVETTPSGQQVGVQTADQKTGAGSLFGLAISPSGKTIYYVDDGENTLNLLHEAGTTTATTGTSSGGEEKVSLEANPEGQLKYDKTALTAKAGKVSIDFTNMAPLGHNVTVASASGTVVGATPTFQGGSKTLALNLKPGIYKFYCSVPGHRMAGMEGTLTVH